MASPSESASSLKVGQSISFTASVERYEIMHDTETVGTGGVAQLKQALKARISLASTGQHVQWLVSCRCEGQVWSVSKRFSEFAALHDLLCRRLVCMPQLPSKSAVRQFAPEYLEARRSQLNVYLQDLCSRRDAVNCIELQGFFDLADNVPSLRRSAFSGVLQVAEVQEGNFGITDFDYDPNRGYLLLGSSERSVLSRVDTKITNIKLPWEPNAPDIPSSQLSLWRQEEGDLKFQMHFRVRFSHAMGPVALLQRPSTPSKGLCFCGLSDGTVGMSKIVRDSTDVKGEILPLLRHTAAVCALAVDEECCILFTASKDRQLFVFDTMHSSLQHQLTTPTATTRMKYSSHQKRLYCGLAAGTVLVYDATADMQQLCTIPDRVDTTQLNLQPSKIAGLDLDDGSSTMVTATPTGIALWVVKAATAGGSVWGRKSGTIIGMSGKPTCTAWLTSSREILVGFATGSIVIYDVDTLAPSYAWDAHTDVVTSMMWLDESRRLLTASGDKSLKIWDFPSERQARHVAELTARGDDPNRCTTSSMIPKRKPTGEEAIASAGSFISDMFGSLTGGGSKASGAQPSETPATGGYPSESAASAIRPPPPMPRPPPGDPLGSGQLVGQAASSSTNAVAQRNSGNDSDDDLAGWDQ